MSKFLSETGLATLWANIKTLLNTRLSAFGQKGSPGGLAELDDTGKVPASQLPSYVDDVLEYPAKASFPATGESGKIYVSGSDNTSWRWSGTAYVQIKGDLALGETASTAYRGDRGKTAYEHSQAKHAPTTVATTSADGLMAAADKQKLDKLNTDMANVGIQGILDLTKPETVTAIQTMYEGMADNSLKMCLIADSAGAFPSTTEKYITMAAEVAALFGASRLGANVGDIAVIVRFSPQIMPYPVCRVLPYNDSKPPMDGFPGAIGVMTPADKQKLDSIQEGADRTQYVLSNDDVVVGAVRQHVGETNADFRQGMFYVGRDAEPPVATISDDYYAQYMQLDVETFAQKVENRAGMYRFYQEDAEPGVWYLNQGTQVNLAEFGLSNYNITYKTGGFTIAFQPAKPARWEIIS